MRITKEQLRNRVGEAHAEIDQLFRMSDKEILAKLHRELPGCKVDSDINDAVRFIIKDMIMKKFHPGWS